MKTFILLATALFASLTIKAQCDELELISPLELEFCDGDEITLEAVSTGGGEITWTEGENGVPFVLDGFGPTHTFTATSDLDTDCILDVTITIYPTPLVSFSSSVVYGYIPLSVSFVSLGDMGDHEWTFGDGGTSTEVSPTYIYETPGIFDVSLTIETAEGCASEITYNDYISAIDFGSALSENQLTISALYPNPTSDLLTIQFGQEFSKNDEIIIYNSIGETVYRKIPGNIENLTIDVSNFSKGVYRLAVMNSNSAVIYTVPVMIE